MNPALRLIAAVQIKGFRDDRGAAGSSVTVLSKCFARVPKNSACREVKVARLSKSGTGHSGCQSDMSSACLCAMHEMRMCRPRW